MSNPLDHSISPDTAFLDSDIDCVLRIGQLRAEVDRVAGPPIMEGCAPGVPLEVQEKFWRNVLAFETAPRTTLAAKLLEDDGFVPEPLESLVGNDSRLQEALWELIGKLSWMRVFLIQTDHLSDRDLYRLLVEQVLTEETVVTSRASEWNTTIDMADFPTPDFSDPTDVYLAYYADDEMRAMWASDFPGHRLPEKAECLFDRDRLLLSGGWEEEA
jgi:hypothetical protein